MREAFQLGLNAFAVFGGFMTGLIGACAVLGVAGVIIAWCAAWIDKRVQK